MVHLLYRALIFRTILSIILYNFLSVYTPPIVSFAHAMPPHPRLRERIARGELRLPIYQSDPSRARRLGIDTPLGPSTPRTGTIRVLAVLVDFSDKVKTVNATFFDTLIFAAPVTGRGSVRDYFAEVSYGQVDIVTLNLPSSLGWRRAPSTYAYYTGGNYCTDAPYPNNCQKLAEDVVDAINSVVDFAQYDGDGDGYTEPIMLIHAGQGAEWTGSPNDIWSHSWGLRTPRNYDGKIIASYIIQPEYWSTVSSTNSDMTIGVFAHEMGHGFWNLPDLYDRDGSSHGIGGWSLMASGSWNGPGWMGSSPAWPDAWSRIQMGFTTASPITSNVTGYSLPQVYNNPAPTTTVTRLQSLALEDQEYFLLENRQKVTGSYDEYLPGSGLLIWHVDEAMNVYDKQNDYECVTEPHYTCSDTNHYLVALEQADGLHELESKTDFADTGDPFPGSTNKTNWTMATDPESSSWYGSTSLDTCLGVTNISASGSNMTANIQACGIPTNLAASPISQTQINLTWTDNSSTETGFKVERSPNGASDWTEIGTVGSNVTSYASTGLSCGTTYYYRVRSYARSDSGYSNIAHATTSTCPPTAPSNLTATSVSQTQIDLDWTDNSSDENGFYVERSPNGSTNWTQIANVSANTTTYANTGLSCGTTYYYRVRAYNAGGNSAYSNTANASTVVCTPATPSNLTATAASQTQINLSWTDNSNNESGFKVERSPNGTSAWEEIASVGANTTAYSSTGLSCGTFYYYRVRAYNLGGNSNYSNTANTSTVVCNPAAPSSLAATQVSQTQINLTWTDNSTNESGFKVERSPDGSTNWAEIGTVGANATNYSNTGLSCGTTYYYRVRAYNAGGNSAYSNTANASTVICTPAAPSNLIATTASQTQINLSWTDNSSLEIGFRIERSPDGATGWSEIGTVGANTTTYMNASLNCGTTYYYRVRAYNMGGNSTYSNVANASTVVCTPATPSNLTATPASQTQIDLSWNDNSSNESGFKIERSPNGTSGWTEIATLGTNATSYADADLSCGTMYYYRVRAFNAGGNSNYSNVANTTTVACTPAAPSNLAATPVSQSQINLSWTDNSNNETGFKIERSPDGTSNWIEIATLGANTTSYANSGLSCGTMHYYRVRSYNTGANSAYSNIANASTVVCNPVAPSSLTATQASQTQINLSWVDNSSNEIGFRIERSLDGATGWTEIGTVGSDVTTYSSGSLSCSTTYYYRVRAYNAGGNSPYSNSANASTAICSPAAPSGLSAIQISQTQIDLAWSDNSSNESGFKVERSPNGASGWVEIVALGTNVTSYSDTSLDCGTVYYYRVRAFNVGGSSNYSNTANASTVVCVPTAPSNLAAIQVSQTQINLTWIDNSNNENGFKIERSPDGNTEWIEIASLGANATSYTNNGLSCGTIYYYRVRAYNTSGNSSYSNTANDSTVVCTPSAPSNLEATLASPTQINLTWIDNSTNEQAFKIERSVNGTGNWTEIGSTAADVTSFTNQNVSCGTNYYYRVRAYNAGGYSAYSNTANVSTLICPPAPPSNLSATQVSQNQINLNWSDNSNNESSFKIERSLDGVSGWVEIAIVGVNVTSYANTSLNCGTAYFYRVQANNAGGDSAYSNIATASTVVCNIAPPSGLVATPISQTQIDLAWTDNSDNETGFKIERSLDGSSSWTQIAMVGESNTSYTDSGLTCGTMVFYRIRAFNTEGNSAYSNTASASTVVCPPAAPSDLAATPASQTQINLSWTDNSDNESGFTIERSPDGSSGWVEIVSVGANVTSYADSSLSCGTTYYYRARAYNVSGNSAYSNTANASTFACPIAAPSNLAATPASQTQINLSWTDNSDNESGFKVERSLDGISGWVEIAVLGMDETCYADTELSSGVTYYYRVRAYNATGVSEYSNSASATTFFSYAVYLPAILTH